MAVTSNQRRPRLLVRLPYYFLLIGLSAVYYGYVVSLCLNWLILTERRTGLAFILLSVFHTVFGMTVWCLVTAVHRGPGAVGEHVPTSSNGSRDGQADERERDIEEGEEAPLMQGEDAEAQTQAQVKNPRKPRRRSRRRSSHTNSSTERSDEEGERDYLEMRPSSSSDEEGGDSDAEGDFEALYGPEEGEKVQIVYPGASAREGSTLMAKANGKARFCRKCNVSKPDRSHHCSTCGYCILKMDHHCPWLGGCVGFKNYKPFILFLFYADLLSALCGGSCLWAMAQVLDTDIEALGLAPVGWGFMILFGFLFCIMLSGFFPYHLYLATNNRTTIENMERNGRLLSLPPRAESMLSAGTTDLATAGLPTHPKDGSGRQLLPPQAAHHQQFPSQHQRQSENPFLPSSSQHVTAAATFSSSYAASHPQSAQQPLISSATQMLSRESRRALEKGAGQINIYDLGTSSKNFVQAFGGEWYDWKSWIPIDSAGGAKGRGNGYGFPVNRAKLERLRVMNEQLRRSGDMGV